MKKYFLILVCLVATICANAQTTGSLYPQNKSVYVPETYNNIMEVSYDNLIYSRTAVATVTVGDRTEQVVPKDTTEYGFKLDIFATLEKMGKTADNTVFTVKVTNVLPADTIINVNPDFGGNIEDPTPNTYVEDIEGIYLLRYFYPTATVTPEEGVLESTDTKVEVKFSEGVKIEDIFFLSGSRGSQYSNYKAGPTNYSDNLSVDILTKYWNLSSNPANMQIRLGNVTVAYDGIDWIVPDYVFNYSYQSPVAAAEFVGLDPDPSETSAWDVYMDGWGFVNFLFSDEVKLPTNAYAEIWLCVDGEWQVQTISNSDLWADWDWWTGHFAITVPMVPDSSITEENLEIIEVSLYNIEDDPIVAIYDLTSENNQIVRKINSSTGVSSIVELIKSNNIFDINGNVVNADSINSLSRGIYIVNGKKLLVR